MKIQLTHQGRLWDVDLLAPKAISRPLYFDPSTQNVRAFGLPYPEATPFTSGDFIASVPLGGSVNCFGVTLWPHGNGTHTESMGHITQTMIPIGEALCASFCIAHLVSLPTERLGDSLETYHQSPSPDDLVLTQRALEDALHGVDLTEVGALVIRTTQPQHELNHDFSGQNPTYLTHEAMQWIVANEIDHLLVDQPSVDREEDEGELANHRIFWGIAQGKTTPPKGANLERTITELIHVPPQVLDGLYLLNLQVPHFMLDAAPSRPQLFSLQPSSTPT